MSTILNTNGQSLDIPEISDKKNFRCHIIYAEWNPRITHALRDGALDVLHKANVGEKEIDLSAVPGTVEPCQCGCGLRQLAPLFGSNRDRLRDRGDTPHFDYVCSMAAQGTATLNALGQTPVIFGVLTVENEQQALDRAGGIYGNKGAEAAVAAIDMANFHTTMSDKR